MHHPAVDSIRRDLKRMFAVRQCGAASALMLACGGCVPFDPLGAAGPYGPPTLVSESAVRSILFPVNASDCGKTECPGPVPPRYVKRFREVLARQGFPLVSEREGSAPLRVSASHVDISATHCTVEGEATLDGRAIELRKSYTWPPGRFPLSDAHDGRLSLAAAARDAVLELCLTSFAKSLRIELAERGYFRTAERSR